MPLTGSALDPLFIFGLQSRKKGLHEFIQKVMSNPTVAKHPHVYNFLTGTPRHVSARRASRASAASSPCLTPVLFLGAL